MNRTITIGRNPDSTICVSEQFDIVSNDHAEITQQGVEIIFTDHSSNGTIINGQKIQGKSVNIYRGDKIVLAGVYELQWSQIDPLIAPVGRPTVARNIRGDVHSPADGQQRFSGNSRPTDFYRHTQAEESHTTMYGTPPRFEQRQPSVPSERQSSVYSDRKSTSVQVEREVGKWNWGAFYFGWIWGVFNRVYVSLFQLATPFLCFIVTLIGLGIIAPFLWLINLGISIWLGAKGSRMAWDNGAYRNLEHFRSSRHNWNVAAAIFFGISVFIVLISLLLFIDIISKLFL